MAELKVGLAPNKTSFYDNITNTYITLNKPVQSVRYDEADVQGTVERLRKIVHALVASVPALVLYEGDIPQACIDDYEAKFTAMFRTKTHRNVVENGKVIGQMPIADAMRQPKVTQTVEVRDPIRNGVDNVGQPIAPNQAFDRPEKVNEASAAAPVVEAPETPEEPPATEPVSGQEIGEAEVVTMQALELEVEEAPVEEAAPVTKKATTAKKGTKKAE